MLIGCFCFLIIATANLFSLFLTYNYQNPFSIIASVAGIFFNYVISFMFYKWAGDQKEATEEVYMSAEMIDILNEIKPNGNKK